MRVSGAWAETKGGSGERPRQFKEIDHFYF